LIITSTKEGMFYLTFVGQLATSHKNYWSDLDENCTRDASLDRENHY